MFAFNVGFHPLYRRNDAISNVREAACWALHQIGGQEVEDIFRVIKDLEHELRMLRDATT